MGWDGFWVGVFWFVVLLLWGPFFFFFSRGGEEGVCVKWLQCIFSFSLLNAVHKIFYKTWKSPSDSSPCSPVRLNLCSSSVRASTKQIAPVSFSHSLQIPLATHQPAELLQPQFMNPVYLRHSMKREVSTYENRNTFREKFTNPLKKN